jgi:hypothetical protein
MLKKDLWQARALLKGLFSAKTEYLGLIKSLADFSHEVDTQLGVIETERTILLKEFAKKDKKGNPVIEQDKYILEDDNAFMERWDELLNQEIKMKGLTKKDLGMIIEAFKLSVNEYLILKPLIK